MYHYTSHHYTMDDFNELAAALPILVAVVIASGPVFGTLKFFLGFDNENREGEG
jgi:hypothetical protein